MQYRIVGIGEPTTVVTVKRRYRVYTVGRLAAISIPTAEMRRLYTECDGDLEKVLGPMRDALTSAGFSDLFILPAQTKLVELIPEETANKTDSHSQGINDYYRIRLLQLSKAAMDVVKCLDAPKQERDHAVEILTSVVTQVAVEAWEK